MIKIIDGKRYNTETATLVADYSNDLGKSDFRWFEEELYLTKKGVWFITGEGGPMSPYNESCGDNSWCGSSDLRLLSSSEAKEWLEHHDEIEALEKHFTIVDG